MQKIFFLSAFLLLLNSINGQPLKQTLTIGDTFPAMNISNIINNQNKTWNSGDLKGKLTILDFWATWCSPCIRSLKGVDSVIHEFGNRVTVLPVTYEDSAQVKSFLKKVPALKNLRTITNDTLLIRTFKHNSIPHYVWINEKGIIIAITERYEVTKKNISGILRGQPPTFRMLKENKIRIVNRTPEGSPIFSPGVEIRNGDSSLFAPIKKEHVLIHSVLSRAFEGFPGGGTYNDSLFISLWNVPALWLYRIALWKHGSEILNQANTIAEIADDSLYKIITSQNRDGNDIARAGADYTEWIYKNGYNYELRIPSHLKEQKFEIMLAELNNYFGAQYGIKGTLEDRNTEYLSLKRLSEKDTSFYATSATKIFEFDPYHIKINAQDLSFFISKISKPLQLQPRIINETGYEGNISLEINGNLSNVDEINSSLKKYGLELVKRKKIMKIAVVKMK